MTKAKITAALGFNCAPNGHTVENFPMGAIVEGKVADWAIADHSANRMFDPRTETKVYGATETKSRKGKRK
tara:strand:- start:4413 stop:4625 length:213 start_codon:yes stop_codon:yes gene_type:complete